MSFLEQEIWVQAISHSLFIRVCDRSSGFSGSGRDQGAAASSRRDECDGGRAQRQPDPLHPTDPLTRTAPQ
jgi:hypothetical protein